MTSAISLWLLVSRGVNSDMERAVAKGLGGLGLPAGTWSGCLGDAKSLGLLVRRGITDTPSDGARCLGLLGLLGVAAGAWSGCVASAVLP